MLAKGVRKSKSKLAGGLEIFSVSDINYIAGRSDLKTVVSTRLKDHFKNIVSDVSRTMVAYDFMKLIESYSKHTETEEYYLLLKKGLTNLNDLSLESAITELWFYTHILIINGSNINLEKPLDKDNFKEEDSYNFSYDDMSFYSRENGEFCPNHIKFLRLTTRADDPAKIKLIRNSENLAAELLIQTKQTASMHKA
jgi:DNA repair protein RecO (recombination protein O)